MEAEFKIKYMGEAVFLLGMTIEQTADSLNINQTQYIDRKLAEFNFGDLHPATCPLDPRNYLVKATQREEQEFKQLGVSY
jgi:hypothetical protein